MTKYIVSFWVEEKSYDDRPGREYEDFVEVDADNEDDAFQKVKSQKQVGKFRYDFRVSK